MTSLWLPIAIVFLAGDPGGGRGATSPPVAGQVPGFAQPSRVAQLAFPVTGRLQAAFVAEGAWVQAGDLLAQLDDGPQRARTDLAARASENKLAIEIARVKRERFEADFQRIQSLFSAGRAAEAELIAARADFEAARLQVQIEEFLQAQAVEEHRVQRALLEQMRMRAPFAGFVAQIRKESGDAVEPNEAVLTLAQLDPLTVTADVQLSAAVAIRAGRRVRVVPEGEQLAPRDGIVRFASRVADAASQSIRVKIDVSNSDNAWPAGIRVRLEFQPASEAANAPVAGASGASACSTADPR